MTEFLYQIEDLLNDEECKRYIEMFDDPSNVEAIDDKHRKYNRVQFQDEQLANQLYQKIIPYLPKKIKKISVGMNKYIRLSKYVPGQFFGIHKDGINFDKDNKSNMSYATLNIFLNDDFEGGHLVLGKNTVVKPLAGTAVFFDGVNIEHSVTRNSGGDRYIIAGWFK